MHKQVREIRSGIYEIKLYQEKNEIRLFLVTGNHTQRHLLVDTGYKTQENIEILNQIFNELEIKAENLDVFLTHKHHDHTGLAAYLSSQGAAIFMNPVEDRHPYDCLYYSHGEKSTEEQIKVLNRVGVTEARTPAVWNCFQEFRTYYQESSDEESFKTADFPYTPIGRGSKFTYGDYTFHAISLPGHTLGQLGLYEQEHHFVLSADHILQNVIPIVATSYTNEHLLEQYFRSLEQFKSIYRTCTIYPAHGESFTNASFVAANITSAYRKKLLAIQHILSNSAEALTVQEVAFRIYSVYSLPSDISGFFQIKMMISKTFSCLEYLYDQKYCERLEKDGMLFYR